MDIPVTEDLIGSEDEAEITEWFVADGQHVAAGDAIAMLETSKVQLQVEAPVAGTIELLVSAGALVETNSVIARIDPS